MASECLPDQHESCFACGLGNRLGLHLHFETGPDGVARAEWMPSTAFCSYPDRIHGGVLATLMDSALVHALFARGETCATAEMTIRYLSPANPIEPIAIVGSVENERHGIFFCNAAATQGGHPVARARAKFMRLAAHAQPPSAGRKPQLPDARETGRELRAKESRDGL